MLELAEFGSHAEERSVSTTRQRVTSGTATGPRPCNRRDAYIRFGNERKSGCLRSCTGLPITLAVPTDRPRSGCNIGAKGSTS